MTSLLELFPDRFPAKPNGICPREGGKDRLWVSRDGDREHWHCRHDCDGCPRGGDAISYLMRFDSLSYLDACAALGIAPSPPAKRGTSRAAGPDVMPWDKPKAKPVPHASPAMKALPEAWSAQAEKCVDYAAKCLERDKAALAYLESRGLTLATARTYRLGWLPEDKFSLVEKWGIKPDKPNGKLKIGRGLLIPVMLEGRVVSLASRNPSPAKQEPRYWQVKRPAGVPEYQFAYLAPGQPAVIVEGQFDALAVLQEARDMVGVIALGGKSKEPQAHLLEVLKTAPAVFLALDRDEAGSEGTKALLESLPRQGIKATDARTWGTEKDLGDCLKNKGPIREWVKSLCEGLQDAKRPEPEPKVGKQANVPQKATQGQKTASLQARNKAESKYERFCSRYWHGCFACPEFEIDKIHFCKKWNREHGSQN